MHKRITLAATAAIVTTTGLLGLTGCSGDSDASSPASTAGHATAAGPIRHHCQITHIDHDERDIALDQTQLVYTANCGGFYLVDNDASGLTMDQVVDLYGKLIVGNYYDITFRDNNLIDATPVAK